MLLRRTHHREAPTTEILRDHVGGSPNDTRVSIVGTYFSSPDTSVLLGISPHLADTSLFEVPPAVALP